MPGFHPKHAKNAKIHKLAPKKNTEDER